MRIMCFLQDVLMLRVISSSIFEERYWITIILMVMFLYNHYHGNIMVAQEGIQVFFSSKDVRCRTRVSAQMMRLTRMTKRSQITLNKLHLTSFNLDRPHSIYSDSSGP